MDRTGAWAGSGMEGELFAQNLKFEVLVVILLCTLLVGGEQAELDGAHGSLGAV